MNVLLIHLSDYHQGGGGGVAMNRLHRGLRQAGVDSRILCGLKTIPSPYISTIPRRPRTERLLKILTSNLGLNDIHLIGSFEINNLEVYNQADILDFHGMHSGTLSYLALPALTRNKPAVFTLHDMWALTGHCGYSYDCTRWQTGCGRCPYPDTNPPVKRDGTRWEWKLKNWAYSQSNLAIVAVSRWLADLAQKSMLERFPIYHIPNGIDTNLYEPLDRDQCRALLGIPPRKKVLMFGALNVKHHRKGGDLLLAALEKLPAALKKEIVLLVIGSRGQSLSQIAGIQTIDMGFVTHARLKAMCYSAADLFVQPTRADNAPLVLLESMACGTPMVSFRVGGVPELVRPGVNGYLAEPEDAQGFSQGIVQLLEDEALRSQLSRQCRSMALEEYTLDLQVARYIELYHKLVQNSVPQKGNMPHQSVPTFGRRPRQNLISPRYHPAKLK